MRPRKAPNEFGVGVVDEALRAADRYGARNRYRQPVDHALDVVEEYLKYGLPEELVFEDTIRVQHGSSAGDWWLYIDEVQGIYLGFAETARAESLRLVALAPAELVSRAEFLRMCSNAA